MLRWRHVGADSRARRQLVRVGTRRIAAALGVVGVIVLGPAAASAAARPVANLLPEVVGAPAIGERLVCGAGSWSGLVSDFKYQWLREGLPTGAGGVAYEVTFADAGYRLWCRVTANGGEGSTEAESSNSLQIPGGRTEAPRSVAPPQVTGTPAVEETLTCSSGTWSGNPTTFTYQWVRDPHEAETPIEAATKKTYKVTNEDAGHSLACEVTATNSAGSTQALSAEVRVPGTTPVATVAPKVLGLEPAHVGETLTCWPGTWSGTPPPTFAYRWVRDKGQLGETFITSATGKTYEVASADQRHSLSCAVTASNTAGEGTASSANSISVGGSPPVDETPPRVTGAPSPGQSLTCQPGTWSGLPAPALAFAWVRNQGMTGEEIIAGATENRYLVASTDQGQTISCRVTASNEDGSASQLSSPIGVESGHGHVAPRNTKLPTLRTPLRLQRGEKLECSGGEWSGEPVPRLLYRWLRDGLPIGPASETGGSYTIAEPDQGHSVACEVTAVNDEGVASATSAAVAVPGVAPQNLQEPRAEGIPAPGQTLLCLRGTWSGLPRPVLKIQWLRNGANIPGATQESYRVSGADRGAALSCRVSAENNAGTAAAVSNVLEIAGGRPQPIELPEVVGVASVGSELTCSPGSWYAQPPVTGYAYQWLLAGVPVPGATAPSYAVVSPDRGLALSCRVTATNREGSGSAVSKEVHVAGVKPHLVEAPFVSGTPAVLRQLTCNRGTWTGAPPPTFSYQWRRDGVAIASAADSTYVAQVGDEGHALSCLIAASNNEGTAEAESSPVTIAVPTEQAANLPNLNFGPASAQPTVAQIAGTLKAQLARAQHHARISSLRRTGSYVVSVDAPVAGTLQLVWYQAPTSSRHGARPLVVATATTVFSAAGTKTVKLLLTSAGRRLIERAFSLRLTLRGVFTRPHQSAASWLKTVVLTY
jgi:hypothetical protein